MGTYEVTTDGGVYQIETEDTPISSNQELPIERPSLGQAASFVGRSFAEGLGKVADLGIALNPFTGPSEHPGTIGTGVQDLMHSLFGKPEDSGIVGTVADLSRAAMEGVAFPGAPIANAITSVGAEVAHKIAPENQWAPVIGALATGGGLSLAQGMSKGAVSAGKSFERASIGASTRDYLRSLKNRGTASFTDEETGELGTRLSQAINEIGDTEGFGILRDPQRLASKNQAVLSDLGGKIGKTLEAVDNAGVVPSVNLTAQGSAVQNLISKAKSQKAELKDALAEFQLKFFDPVDGWNGTATALNGWKSDIGNMAFSGSAKGVLSGATERQLKRAIYADLSNAVDEAVVKSGVIDPADWSKTMRVYSNHAELVPVLNPELAKNLSSTYDQVARGLIRTSGGTLTTPTLIGGAIGTGIGGPLVGLATGATLAAVSSPTGRGLVGNALKAGGRFGKEVAKGAPLATISQALKAGLQNNEPTDLGNINSSSTPISQTFAPSNSSSSTIPSLFNSGVQMEKQPVNLVQQEQDIQPLVKAVIQQESGGKPGAVSDKGAVGLMQIMPETGKELFKKYKSDLEQAGIKADEYSPKDPEQNKFLGTQYLKELLNQFGDPELALTAYHSGPGRVEKLLKLTKGNSLADIVDLLGPVGQKYAKQVLGRLDSGILEV